jgi:hypothetical protein
MSPAENACRLFGGIGRYFLNVLVTLTRRHQLGARRAAIHRLRHFAVLALRPESETSCDADARLFLCGRSDATLATADRGAKAPC